ncbi:MAG TPA: lamin tail domain-containing protein [Gaiellaceae bacterium]|nr:lamin tail domain-containing protein [Gaiellaceae bacterium]
MILASLAALLAAPAALGASPDLVVNQVFAGGGNAGAPYSNDFVELFNRGSSAVDVGGWSIQYASGSGTSWQVTPLSGSVQAGGHYLVQLASGSVGAALPTPDASGTSNLAVSGGKVALAHATTALTCGAAAGSCSADPLVTDLVGYGSATDYEGAGAAPAIGNTTAAVRADGGCTDTDVNSSDFSAAAPTPRNSAATAAPCSAPPPPSGGVSQNAPVDIDVDSVLSLALERPSISFGHAAAGETPASVSERVTVASNHMTGYALTVHRSAFVPADLPLGLSASAPPGGQLGGQLVGGAMAAIPIAPAADLLIGTTSAPSAPAGDAWATNVGFVSPLPFVTPGHYTATVTYTAIGR